MDRRIRGSFDADADGVELADDDAARKHVLQASLGMLRDLFEATDRHPLMIAAKSGAGKVVCRIKVTLEDDGSSLRSKAIPRPSNAPVLIGSA